MAARSPQGPHSPLSSSALGVKKEREGPKAWTSGAWGWSWCSGPAAPAASCPPEHTGRDYRRRGQKSTTRAPKGRTCPVQSPARRSSSLLHATLASRAIPDQPRVKEAAAQETWQHQTWSSRRPRGPGCHLTHRAPSSKTGTGHTGVHQPKVLPATGSSTHHEHTRLLPIHEALGDGVWRQDFVSRE